MPVHGIVVNVIAASARDDISIVKVNGYLDTTTAAELEEALYNLLQKENYRIVVDLSDTTYISSAGWGIFIGEIKEIRNRGGDLKLAGMNGDVFEVFQLLEFQSILNAHDTAEEARLAFATVTGKKSL